MRLLMVEDSEAVRRRLRSLLSQFGGIEVVGEAEDAPQAVEAARRLSPDAIMLDIRLLGGSGLDVLRGLKKDGVGPVVVVLTNYPYPEYRQACLAAGADYFFDKSTEFEHAIEVLRQLGEDQ